MNLRVTFKKGTAEDTAELRRRYLDGLPEAQELMLELLVPRADHYLICARGTTCGYFLLHEGAVLIELYLLDEYVPYCHSVLQSILERTGAASAWIKTFDALFLSYALDFQVGVCTLGCLARGYARRELPHVPSIRYTRRLAHEDDLGRLLAVDQEVFVDPERFRHVVARGYVHVFERDSALVGFGITRPVIEGRPDTELGIVVDTPFRNRGYALYMLRELADHCVESGRRPIAGCSLDNAASWRMGLRVGMISLHRLLEVRFRQAVAASPEDTRPS